MTEVSTTAGSPSILRCRRSCQTWESGHICSARAISADGRQRRIARIRVSRLFAPCPAPSAASVPSRLPALVGSVTIRGRARNVPSPWWRRTFPARSSSSSARRTVIRLTPVSSASSAWVGSMSPGASPRSATSCSTYETTCS